MKSHRPQTPSIGYCTNVHPGVTLDDVLKNLVEHSSAVRSALGASEIGLPCGLWLNETVEKSLVNPDGIGRLQEVLAENDLCVQSLNGFPMGDFHQPVVKHLVYQPAWNDRRRLDYTKRLAGILVALLGDRSAGSISTSPLGWRARNYDDAFLHRCAVNLLDWVRHAMKVEESTGKRIRLAIEPEPGCCLNKARDVTEFFATYLIPEADRLGLPVLQYLGVCHDICHSAVMFESQESAIQQYRSAGIRIWKVQVSSAIEARFGSASTLDEQNPELIKSLMAFGEPKFLHQTSTSSGEFFDDLPEAIESAQRSGIWRIHFHVPVFAETLGGGLSTTQPEIAKCVGLLKDEPEIDWEVETYAWGVLPEHLQPESLVSGIADEIRWTRKLFGVD